MPGETQVKDVEHSRLTDHSQVRDEDEQNEGEGRDNRKVSGI